MFPFREFIYISWMILFLSGRPISFFFPTVLSLIMFFIWEIILMLVHLYTIFMTLSTIAVYHRCKNMVEFPRESSSALAVTTFMLNPRKGFQELRHGIKFEPEVSVIVCTKNEEKNIATVLSSLLAVDYPKDKYEILIVDESKDRTPEIVRSFAQNNSHPEIRLLSRFELPEKPDHFNPVAYGITLAVERAKNDIIVITEADCRHHEQYLKRMVHPYYEFTTGCVGSQAVFTGDNLIEQLLRLDLGGYAYFGLAAIDAIRNAKKFNIYKWNISGGCWGGSISFRRSIFNEIGGYEGIESIHVQDIALTNKILKFSKKKMVLLLDKEAKVESPAESSFKQAIKQRLRWYGGGFQMGYRFNPQYMLGQFLWFQFPFFAETALLIMFILSLFLPLPVPGVYYPVLTTYIPFSLSILQNINLWLAISAMIYFLCFRYLVLFQITKYDRLLNGYKTSFLTWLIYPLWMYFTEWLMAIAFVKREYEWKK